MPSWWTMIVFLSFHSTPLNHQYHVETLCSYDDTSHEGIRKGSRITFHFPIPMLIEGEGCDIAVPFFDVVT